MKVHGADIIMALTHVCWFTAVRWWCHPSPCLRDRIKLVGREGWGGGGGGVSDITTNELSLLIVQKRWTGCV